jgi:O-antigen/teichoic acid export membrane protein
MTSDGPVAVAATGDKNRIKALRILRNVGSLTIGKTLGDAFTFLFFAIASRTFGQEGIGQYSFAIALTGFFVVLADFGLYNFSVKEMSRRSGSLSAYYGHLFQLRLVLAGIIFSLLLLVLPFFSFPRETKLVIVLIGAYQMLYVLVDILTAVFVAREDMHLAGLLEFAFRFVIAASAIAVMWAGGTLITTLTVFPVATFGFLIIAYAMVAKKYGRPQLHLSWSAMTHTLHEAVPYALFTLLRQISTRVDVVLLGFFLSESASGIYNVAYRIIFFMMILSHFTGLALFPLASRLYVNSKEKLAYLYQTALNLVVLIGLPAAAGIWLVAPALIDLIYGDGFAESALILRYLAWLVFLAFMKGVLGVFLTACDRQAERTKGQWTAAWINVIANALLIPTIGVKGAAIATLLSESALVMIFMLRLKSVIGWPHIGSRLAFSSIATMAFCLPAVLWSSSLFLVVPVSIFLYLGVLASFKDVRIHEFRMFWNLLRGGSITWGILAINDPPSSH